MDTSVKRECINCAHVDRKFSEEPCKSCTVYFTNWQPVAPKAAPEQLTLVSFPSAPGILQDAADILKERGQSRDKGDSERSMATVVNIFNAAEGLNLTEEQGWKFMLCLKLGRMKGGKFHFDDYQDLVGYSALLAECAATEQLKGNT